MEDTEAWALAALVLAGLALVATRGSTDRAALADEAEAVLNRAAPTMGASEASTRKAAAVVAGLLLP